KDLRPTLYDENVIGLGYTPMFLTHSDEALEIEKYKRSREDKIEFAYDYGNLNASYVNENINFEDDYFQEIINPDFEKIDSPFQQTSSLKPYVPNVILEKIIIDLEDEVILTLLVVLEDLRIAVLFGRKKGRLILLMLVCLLMNDLLDDMNFFIFDDVNVRISLVSKMPFRKKPRDSMHICLWIIDSGCSKHMTGNRALLTNFVEKFLGTVLFGNNDFAAIAGYGDVVIGYMMIKKVYYVEGLGHNLLSVGHFCDKGLEVAFRKSTCFVRNEDGVDLLTGDRSSNLYTIDLNEVASNSLTCLPKMKFEKDYLCSTCEQRKIHQKHHKSKTAFASNKPLYLLHMDLCRPMRVHSINGKRYVLVVVDDYSRYTWVFFFHSKDEASEVIISFIKKTQVNLQLQVQRVRTDNGTEFKNKTLAKCFDEVGITQQFSAARTPQQNGVVERRNRTLVEAARTMLTFANLPLFLWAEAIATACFTQNRLIIHKRFDKTPYELINKRKPNIKFFRVFECICYLLNDYEDVGKLKAKRDIGVFVGYSKEYAAFRIYNKRTRKIHESVNVNFHEISEMASKKFSLKPGLSNLNKTGKSSNRSVSKVDEASKNDLE
nr:hypothetical protein [Tanacetum cinerariifolium]